MSALRRTIVLLSTTVLSCGIAWSQQDFPNRPVRFVVPFPAGGPTDAWARLVGQKLSELWGQPTIIDNRIGATGLIGTNFVKQQLPDGYVLLFTSNSAHVAAPLLRHPAPFDPIADFTPITAPLRYTAYLVTSPKLPVKTFKEFIALAKAQPGKLTYSSVGIGSLGHLSCEMMNLAAGINTLHIPYKGAAPAQAAAVAGETNFTCDSIGNSQAMVAAGRLNGLATTGAKRSTVLKDVPTMMEEGVPVEVYVWLGLVGPKGMPDGIRDKIVKDVARAMQLPELRERAAKDGMELIEQSPEELAKAMAVEKSALSRVIAEKNIKAE